MSEEIKPLTNLLERLGFAHFINGTYSLFKIEHNMNHYYIRISSDNDISFQVLGSNDSADSKSYFVDNLSLNKSIEIIRAHFKKELRLLKINKLLL